MTELEEADVLVAIHDFWVKRWIAFGVSFGLSVIIGITADATRGWLSTFWDIAGGVALFIAILFSIMLIDARRTVRRARSSMETYRYNQEAFWMHNRELRHPISWLFLQ